MSDESLTIHNFNKNEKTHKNYNFQSDMLHIYHPLPQQQLCHCDVNFSSISINETIDFPNIYTISQQYALLT